MIGNGAIAALVAITAPSGYVEFWAAPIIGVIAGILVVARASSRSTRSSTIRWVRCPRTAWPASGARSRAGCSPRPRLADYNGVGDPGLVLQRLVHPARSAGRRRLRGLRVGVHRSSPRSAPSRRPSACGCAEEDEDAGLDISEHGMYGYPEQFIPAAELVGLRRDAGRRPPRPSAAYSTSQEAPAT